MKISTAIVRKINGEPAISGNISETTISGVVSGMVNEQLSGQIVDEVTNQVQNLQLSGDWLTRDMLTFK